MAGRQWARLRADLDCDLRRGAWYRILKMASLEVVVDVKGKSIPVPRPFVEILATPPQRWTVVPRPDNAPRLPTTWGPYYAVCPSCRDRAPVLGRPANMRCPRCNGLFDIAWNEEYLVTSL